MSFDPSAFATDTFPDAAPEGERWSSWDGSTHGPAPRPDWVITELGAVESDLGILKTGKEADVHVVRRWVPDGTDAPARDVLMAAKRYRSTEHRTFNRSAAYTEGRSMKRSRDQRAIWVSTRGLPHDGQHLTESGYAALGHTIGNLVLARAVEDPSP